MRVVRLLLVLGVLSVCAIPAMADSIFNVTGTLTIAGNNVCGGGPCVETLGFSFDVTWDEFAPGQFNPVILPGTEVTSSGPLGSFALGAGSVGNTFIQFFDNGGPISGDEIDIDVANAPVASSPQPLQLLDSYLYSCLTTTCATDFASPPFEVPSYGIFLPGTIQFKETAVAETGTLSYLLLALGLGLVGAFARRPMRRGLREAAQQAFRD